MQLKLNKETRVALKKYKFENQKKFFYTPLWKLVYNGKSLTLSQDNVERCKMINNDSYLMVRRERYLQGLSKN